MRLDDLGIFPGGQDQIFGTLMPGGAVNITFGELGRQGEFEEFLCVFLAPDHHGKKIFHKKTADSLFTCEKLFLEQPAIYFVRGGFKTAQITLLNGKCHFNGPMGIHTAPDGIILALRLFTAQPMISAIQAA